MRKLLATILFTAGAAYGAATPIANLAISTDANGRGNSWTNLADVVLTNGTRLSTVSGGGGSGTFTNILWGTNANPVQAIVKAESNIVFRSAGGTNYAALAGTIAGNITFSGDVNANGNIEVANTKHIRFIDGGGTNTVHLAATAGRLIVSGAVDIVTGQATPATVNGIAIATASDLSARLASNVWEAAGSTTNYALRRDGRGYPIYGIGNVFSDGGHAAINEMNTRLDFRSTNKSFSVLGLYQAATNLNTDWPPALDLWNYGSTVTGVIPENIRSGKLLLGVHTAEGTWGPQLYGIWGGASNDGFGLVTAFADSFGTPAERTRVTWQGLTVSGTVTAAGFASSNVVAKTGDTMTGPLAFAGSGSSGPASIAITNGWLNLVSTAAGTKRIQLIPFDSGSISTPTIFFETTNNNGNIGISPYTNSIEWFPGGYSRRLIIDQANAKWLNFVTNLNAVGGLAGGITNGQLTIDASGTFTSIATNGSGNVVTNLAFGGSVITQQMGTVTGGGGAAISNAFVHFNLGAARNATNNSMGLVRGYLDTDTATSDIFPAFFVTVSSNVMQDAYAKAWVRWPVANPTQIQLRVWYQGTTNNPLEARFSNGTNAVAYVLGASSADAENTITIAPSGFLTNVAENAAVQLRVSAAFAATSTVPMGRGIIEGIWVRR